jgi:hypothetical protein
MNEKYFSNIGKYALKGFQKRKPYDQMETIGILHELRPESTTKYRNKNSEDNETDKINKLLDVRTPIKERENEEKKQKYLDFIKKMVKEQKSRTA